MIVEGESMADPGGAGLSPHHDEDGGRWYMLLPLGVRFSRVSACKRVSPWPSMIRVRSLTMTFGVAFNWVMR